MGSGEGYLPSGYTFVIADDHPLFRGALKEALSGIGDVAAIHEAGTFETAKALVVANEDVDLVLLDLSMPGTRGLEGVIDRVGAPVRTYPRSGLVITSSPVRRPAQILRRASHPRRSSTNRSGQA